MHRTALPAASRPSYRLLYAAIVICFALRFYRLGAQSIWGDEALTLLYYTTGDNLAQTWRHIWSTAGHPPLYFLTVFYWFKLGHSEFMLRFPSLVYGIAAVPIMYALANRLYGHRIADIAALTVATSPIHIWYSQEARMYSLQILLLLTSTLFMVKAWQEQRFRYYALFAVFSILALFTHMATALFIAGQAVFMLITHKGRSRVLAAWVGSFVLIGVVFAPWVLRFIVENTSHGDHIAVGYERPSSYLDTAYAYYAFSTGYSFGPSVAELHWFNTHSAVALHLTEILIPALIFGALAVLGLRRALESDRATLTLVVALLLVPTVLAFAGSRIPGFPLNPRYMLPTIIPYWLILALGIQACAKRWTMMVVPLIAVLITGVSLRNYYCDPAYMKQDMRSATGLINRSSRAGDVIVISSVELGGPFIYYFKRHDVPYVGYPHGGWVDPTQVSADMDKVTAGKDRVWLLLGRTWSSDPRDLIKQHFDRLSSPIEHRGYQDLSVLCYDLKQP